MPCQPESSANPPILKMHPSRTFPGGAMGGNPPGPSHAEADAANHAFQRAAPVSVVRCRMSSDARRGFAFAPTSNRSGRSRRLDGRRVLMYTSSRPKPLRRSDVTMGGAKGGGACRGGPFLKLPSRRLTSETEVSRRCPDALLRTLSTGVRTQSRLSGILPKSPSGQCLVGRPVRPDNPGDPDTGAVKGAVGGIWTAHDVSPRRWQGRRCDADA